VLDVQRGRGGVGGVGAAVPDVAVVEAVVVGVEVRLAGGERRVGVGRRLGGGLPARVVERRLGLRVLLVVLPVGQRRQRDRGGAGNLRCGLQAAGRRRGRRDRLAVPADVRDRGRRPDLEVGRGL